MRLTRPRRGFTLVELLVSLALLGVVLAAVLGALARQQRFYRDFVDVIESRRQLRHALGVLQPELRAIALDASAAEGSDLLALADSAVELRAFVGSSVLCGHDSAATFDIPPRELASGAIVTAWLSTPRAGDVAFVYDEGVTVGDDDDRWRAYDVASISDARTHCAASPLLRAADAGRTRHRIALAGTARLSATIRRGAPVRFARRTRYSLYRAADGDWFLGQREWSGGWSTTQPVSGPYAPYSTSATSGLSIVAHDSNGATVARDGAVAALAITARARTAAPLASALGRGRRRVAAEAIAAPARWAR